MKPLLQASTCAFSAIAMPCGTAFAQATYPIKPVRLIVAFDPGGSTEIARLVSPKLAEQLGKSVIIDNRGGGGGTIGAEMAARHRFSLAPGGRNAEEHDRNGYRAYPIQEWRASGYGDIVG